MMRWYLKKTIQQATIKAWIKIDPSLNASRRKFLSQMSTLSAGLLIPHAPLKHPKAPNVVVVGAGIAGLNALHVLNKKGIKNEKRIEEIKARFFQKSVMITE